eukprot:144848_1
MNHCQSAERRNLRQHRAITRATSVQEQQKDINSKYQHENENISKFNQHYIQNRLDAIHCALSHNDYTQYVPKYADQKEQYKNDKDATKITQQHDKHEQNTEKYISYGFGIHHDHTKLSPSFNSVRSELLFNSIYPVDDHIFQLQMIKSIQTKHSTNTTNTKCKYYDPRYNILLNEPIGIRHFLSLTTYSDITAFCTEFRKTYRKISNEDENDVIKRHIQLYYYAKSLFESVQFFGCYMKENEKVRHGLACGSQQTYFQKFRAHF